MLKKISSNLLRAAMKRTRAKSQSECASSSSTSLHEASNADSISVASATASRSSEELGAGETTAKWRVGGSSSAPPAKRGRGRPPKSSDASPHKDDAKDRADSKVCSRLNEIATLTWHASPAFTVIASQKESPTAASMGHAIVVLDDIANDAKIRYDFSITIFD